MCVLVQAISIFEVGTSNYFSTFYSGRLGSSLAQIAQPQTYCKVQNTHSTCREFHCPPFTRKSYHTSEVLSHNSYQTHPVLQSKCLQHWFKNWHELRRNKLTASTFGMAIGFWPRRRVQLWLEKVGAIEPFSGDLATFWSNIKEEEALEQYKLKTGNPISFPKFQLYGKENPQDDWLAGSPDGVVEVDVFHGCRSSGILEIKCPYFDGDKQKAYPWSRIPLYCMPQAQGLMEIMDKEWMDLYVWTLNGSSLFRIPRDREYWELVKMALSDFWWEHVQPAKEMYSISNATNPLIQLRSLKPAPRHELCGAIVHWSKCLVDDSVLLEREITTEPRFEKFNPNSWKRSSLRWEKPIEGWVKLNFDGAWNPVTRVGEAGWVLRDHNGVVISGAQQRIFDSAQEVEAWALKLGTEFAKAEGMDKMQFEGDAELYFSGDKLALPLNLDCTFQGV